MSLGNIENETPTITMIYNNKYFQTPTYHMVFGYTCNYKRFVQVAYYTTFSTKLAKFVRLVFIHAQKQWYHRLISDIDITNKY